MPAKIVFEEELNDALLINNKRMEVFDFFLITNAKQDHAALGQRMQ